VRLVGAVLLLVAIALAGSGAVARALMQQNLVNRADSKIADMAQGIAQHGLDGYVKGRDGDGPHPPGDGPGRPDADFGRTPPSGFVYEVTDASGKPVKVWSNPLDASPLPRFPQVNVSQNNKYGTRAFSVPAVSGDTHWQVVAVPVTLANGSRGTLLIAQSLNDVHKTVEDLTRNLAIIGAAALAIIAAVGYLVVRISLRPLRSVEQAAATIAAGDLSHRVPEADPRTEVGHLSTALNTMLEQIETAFAQRAASEQAARHSEEQMRRSEAAARRSEERMRRFVADASHELRTPLTTIRGFAELYRQGAAAAEGDIARLMRRIEDEAKRMGLLVEDLLLLARMDQERPLAQHPVDMLALAGDAVHDARALAPEREIRLDVTSTDPPPVVIGDEPRLRQVLANLLSNALRHTPAGTPVTVTVATGPGSWTGKPAVVLTVADRGPGLTPEAAARVFERFYRADAARNRHDGGTGLGLAIVAALVAGHGGHVDVESRPGAGACFRVELPLAAVAAASA
jgi:two-component system OmpR family sensor kinase